MTMTFGARLRSIRKQAGMSQSQLATACGGSPSQVADWEAGRRGAPRTKRLTALADALGVSTDRLLGRSREKPRPPAKPVVDPWKDVLGENPYGKPEPVKATSEESEKNTEDEA